eukprot:6469029-Amphidinium_carterae.1
MNAAEVEDTAPEGVVRTEPESTDARDTGRTSKGRRWKAGILKRCMSLYPREEIVVWKATQPLSSRFNQCFFGRNIVMSGMPITVSFRLEMLRVRLMCLACHNRIRAGLTGA